MKSYTMFVETCISSLLRILGHLTIRENNWLPHRKDVWCKYFQVIFQFVLWRSFSNGNKNQQKNHMQMFLKSQLLKETFLKLLPHDKKLHQPQVLWNPKFALAWLCHSTSTIFIHAELFVCRVQSLLFSSWFCVNTIPWRPHWGIQHNFHGDLLAKMTLFTGTSSTVKLYTNSGHFLWAEMALDGSRITKKWIRENDNLIFHI